MWYSILTIMVVINAVISLISVDKFNSQCNQSHSTLSRITSVVLDEVVYLIDGSSPVIGQDCPAQSHYFKWSLNPSLTSNDFQLVDKISSRITAGAGFASDGLICLIGNWSSISCFSPSTGILVDIDPFNEFEWKGILYDHTVTYDPHSRMGILVGGAWDDSNGIHYITSSYRFKFIPHNPLQPLSTTNSPKVQINKLNPPSYASGGLIGHTSTLIDKTVYIVGGSKVDSRRNDEIIAVLHNIDKGDDWTYIKKPHFGLDEFRDHVTFHKNGHLVIVGGRSVDPPNKISNQILIYHLKSNRWASLPSSDSLYRAQAALVQSNTPSDYVALVGGITTFNQSELFTTDIQILDISHLPDRIELKSILKLKDLSRGSILSTSELIEKPKKEGFEIGGRTGIPLLPILGGCLAGTLLILILAGLFIRRRLRHPTHSPPEIPTYPIPQDPILPPPKSHYSPSEHPSPPLSPPPSPSPHPFRQSATTCFTRSSHSPTLKHMPSNTTQRLPPPIVTPTYDPILPPSTLDPKPPTTTTPNKKS